MFFQHVEQVRLTISRGVAETEALKASMDVIDLGQKYESSILADPGCEISTL